MKKLFLIILILLNSCGFQAIYSTNNSNFSIIEIESEQRDKISKRIKNNLKKYKAKKKTSNKEFKLKIISDKKVKVASKDKKGNPEIFEIQITLNLTAYNNNSIVSKKEFNETFQYDNDKNKFNLDQYKNVIEENLINKITENIILHLYSL